MKRLTLALLGSAFIAAPALAQMQSNPDFENTVRTRDLTDSNIYTTARAYDEGSWFDATFDDVDSGWNQIGEVEDVVLDRNGNMIGIIAEVGGFLDIADKHVMIPLEDLKFVPAEDEGHYVVVTRQNEEQLESLAGLDEAWYE
jgi:hypothetical protein